MAPDHAGYLVPGKYATDGQTDMNGLIRCSSLLLKHKEHLIMLISNVQRDVKRTISIVDLFSATGSV